MDYQSEFKKIEEFSGDFWKPKPGQYKVKALSEVLEAESVRFGEGDESELQERAQIKIQVIDKDGKQKAVSWNFPKGKTSRSTYGQLVHLGAVKGSLEGLEFTVVVLGEGQDVRFTIVA